jgi:hypothetical protein
MSYTIDYVNGTANYESGDNNNSVSITGEGIGVSDLSGNITTNVNSNQVYITDGGSGGTNIMSFDSTIIDNSNGCVASIYANSMIVRETFPTYDLQGYSNCVGTTYQKIVNDEPIESTTYARQGFGSNMPFDISLSYLTLNGPTGLPVEGKVITANSSGSPTWASPAKQYPQVQIIDLQSNYTINPADITSPNYILWAKTSAAGLQTINLPTTLLSVGQRITIRSEADSSSVNSGTGNLIYRGITPLITATISQASCVQFLLAQITGSVYNWIVISTS